MPIRLTLWVEAALAVRMWAPVDAYVGDSIGPPHADWKSLTSGSG
jgi:hypothetical protein